MKTLLIGSIATVLVLFFSLEGQAELFLQWHSVLIVFVGTLTLFLFITPWTVIKNIGSSIKALGQKDSRFGDVEAELMQLAQNRAQGSNSKNQLIRYASELWSQGLDPNLFIALLSQKRNELIEERADAVQGLKSLAKYPPALGMTGTVMGMVALFSNLDGNTSNVGENLAIAMTATFYGLILTNVLVSPLADRVQVKQIRDQRFLTSIYEVLLLINQGEPVALIQEEVRERVA